MSRVLIVDDDPKIRRSIRRHMEREGYDILEAENGKTALERVGEFSPDIILLDVMMPIMNGFEACQALREDFRQEDFFIIMVSAKAKAEDIVRGLDIGADDYVSKPFNPQELLARVRAGIRTLEAKRYATIDPLTNLYNRYYFNSFIGEEINRTKRSGNPLSMVLLNIGFNNTFPPGKTTNDDILVEMGTLLRESSRRTDVCVRWGEEEFIVLLVSTDQEGANHFAEKLQKTIHDRLFPNASQTTLNLGVATLKTDGKDLFKRVSDALRQAKNNGGNRIVTA